MAHLYVSEQGSRVHLQGGRVIVQSEDDTIASVPRTCVDALLLFGRVSISAPLIHHCLNGGCNVAFFSQGGRYLGRMEGTLGKNIPLRIRQVKAMDDAPLQLSLASAITQAKVRNCYRFIRRQMWNHSGLDYTDDLRVLKRIQQRCRRSADLKNLRSLEGRASRIYFRCLADILKPRHSFTARTRRPPRGMMNILLSLGYSLITAECAAAIEGAGLDPGIGVIHCLRYGRPSLALDLVEEFRTPVAERLAMFLLMNDAREFRDEDEQATVLSPEAFKRYIRFYEQLMNRSVTSWHGPTTIRQAVHRQANALARCLRVGLPEYRPFYYR